jgi:hypothetical protein
LINQAEMRSARVIQAIDHGSIVQVLCADERGLLSIYFDNKPFNNFMKILKKAGLTLKALEIKFDLETVSITSKRKTVQICRTREKAAAI